HQRVASRILRWKYLEFGLEVLRKVFCVVVPNLKRDLSDILLTFGQELSSTLHTNQADKFYGAFPGEGLEFFVKMNPAHGQFATEKLDRERLIPHVTLHDCNCFLD